MGCQKGGLLHLREEGVEKGMSAAAPLFRKARDGGDAEGCYGLSLACGMGRGVPKDAKQAALIQEKPCRGGVAQACNEAGGANGPATRAQ